MIVTNLRCEYLTNPLGIDIARPRLSWELCDDRRGARQTAYQILVCESPAIPSAALRGGLEALSAGQMVAAGRF